MIILHAMCIGLTLSGAAAILIQRPHTNIAVLFGLLGGVVLASAVQRFIRMCE